MIKGKTVPRQATMDATQNMKKWPRKKCSVQRHQSDPAKEKGDGKGTKEILETGRRLKSPLGAVKGRRGVLKK